MKFDCGETYAEYAARLKKWHRWFAWHPVKVADHDCRWLEYVERSVLRDRFLTNKKYRAIQK